MKATRTCRTVIASMVGALLCALCAQAQPRPVGLPVAGLSVPPAGPIAYPAAEALSVRPDAAGKTIRVPQDQPTIRAALDAAADGDTVLLAPGRYEGGVRIGGKAVTLASQFLTTGDAAWIEKTVIDAGKKEFAIYVADTCKPATRIIGLTLRGGSDGIACHAQCSILHNHFVGSGDGIDYEGGGGVCRRNVFDDCSDDAIDLDGDCAVRIEDNVLRNCRDDGIEIRLEPYKAKETLEILIRNNLIAGSGEDGIQIIGYPSPSNRRFWIERNVIRRTAKATIGFMDDADTHEDYRAAPVTDPVYLVNNTLLDNTWGLTGGANLVAVNNLFAGTKRTAVLKSTGHSIFSHNLFWQNGTDWKDSVIDAATAICKDPMLDAGGVPAAASPCVDAGTATVKRGQVTLFTLPAGTHAGRAPDIGARSRLPL